MYYIIETDNKFAIIQTFVCGNTIVSKKVSEHASLNELEESLVPVNAVGAEQVSGLTGEPPVRITKQKKHRSNVLRRFKNVG